MATTPRLPAAEAVGVEAGAAPVLSARRAIDVVVAPLGRATLSAELGAALDGAPDGSCVAVRTASGATVFDHNPDLAVAGASTQKLLTVAGVVDALGPSRRLATQVVAPRPIVDGELDSDLYLVGAGDPFLRTRDHADWVSLIDPDPTDFEALADALVSQGLREVEGRVVGDGGLFDDERTVEDWPSRFRDSPQAGPLGALVVNGGYRRYPTVDPDSPGEIEGRAGGRVNDPAQHAAQTLQELLSDRGVSFAEKADSGVAGPEMALLAEVRSPTVAQMIRPVLRDSDNTAAEMLLKVISDTRPASTTGGARRVLRALRDLGLEVGGVVVGDGSGLAETSRHTCRLLVHTLGHPDLDDLIGGALAVSGQPGTLSNRFLGDLTGRVRAKTGSLRDVTALAGHMESTDGQMLTFAVIVHGDRTLTAGELGVVDAVVSALARYPSVPAVGDLRVPSRPG